MFAEESFTVPMSISKEDSSGPPPASRLPIGTILKGSPNFSQASLDATSTSKSSLSRGNSITPQTVASEADQVAALMRANITTMLERGDSVIRLSEKMEQLQAQAYRFRVHAQRTERHLWWRNLRTSIAIAILSMIAIGIVIAALVKGTTSAPANAQNNVQKSLSQEPFPITSNLHKDQHNLPNAISASLDSVSNTGPNRLLTTMPDAGVA